MANLFNTMADFERRYRWEILRHPLANSQQRRKNFIMMNTAIAVATVSSTHYMATFDNPCAPHVVGYTLIEECTSKTNGTYTLGNFAGKILVVSINWIVLSTYYLSINAELVCFSYLPCVSFNWYADLVHKKMAKLKILRKPNFLRITAIFRENQIMLKAYNDIHQNIAVIAALYQTAFLLTISIYGLVALHSSLLPEQITFFISGSFQAVLVIVLVFGTLGNVYGRSKKMMKNINGMPSLKMDRWCRRVLMSWPIQNIRFGKVNYLDQLTPFTVIEFSVKCALNMLLMG
ncbi:unnamed protein product [Orchesella dallaii]|uniref:Uncharacterized protein n=1 Tax=Orchesella dallaii TaxID=48710 RepID=A0ABP1Q8H2_9HEXA